VTFYRKICNVTHAAFVTPTLRTRNTSETHTSTALCSTPAQTNVSNQFKRRSLQRYRGGRF